MMLPNRQTLTDLLRFNLLFCAIFEADVRQCKPISKADLQQFLRANDAVHLLRGLLYG